MGVVAKLKHTYLENNTMGPGIHLCIVSNMKYARDSENQYLVKRETGEMALDIEFKDGKGLKISSVFWMTEKSQWVFDALCRAVNVNNKSEVPSVNLVKGQRLWIVVGQKYQIKDAQFERDSTGKLIVFNKLVPLFFRVYDPMTPPIVNGDPNRSKGIPSGKFLINKPEEMPENWEQMILGESSNLGEPLVMKQVTERRRASMNTQNHNPKVLRDTALPDAPF